MRGALLLVAASLLLAGCGERSLEVRVDREVRGSVERPLDAKLYGRRPLAVDFVTDEVGLLGAEDGHVLASRDGGVHWQPVSAGEPIDQISMATPRLVFATRSGALLRSVDGGRSWVRAGRLPRHGRWDGPTELQFFDRLNGWRSDTAVWSTVDGGRSWQRRFACPNEDSLGGISFLDARRGFALCGGQPATIEMGKQLWATADGGRTWQVRERTPWFGMKAVVPGGGMPSQGHLGPISFRTDADGWMSSGRIGLYGSTDGGHRWRTVLFSGDLNPTDMSRPSARRSFALLWQVGLMRTDDGGRHWRQLYPPPPGSPTGPVAPSSARVALASGTGGLQRSLGTIVATTDGGRTWAVRARLPGVAVQRFVRGSAARVWAVGYRVPARRTRVSFRSEDDGRIWKRVPLSDVPRRVGVGLRLRGDRLFQRRGGTWHPVVTPARVGLLGLELLDDRHWWLEGHICGRIGPKGSELPCHGALLRTVDAGRHWELIVLPREMVFTGIQFMSPTLGWESGPAGGHWLTRDGGRSWRFVYPRWPS